MSRPQVNVATSFADHFFSSGSQPQFFVATNFLLSYFFVPGHDLKLMPRLQFLLRSSSSGRDINEWS